MNCPGAGGGAVAWSRIRVALGPRRQWRFILPLRAGQDRLCGAKAGCPQNLSPGCPMAHNLVQPFLPYGCSVEASSVPWPVTEATCSRVKAHIEEPTGHFNADRESANR